MVPVPVNKFFDDTIFLISCKWGEKICGVAYGAQQEIATELLLSIG